MVSSHKSWYTLWHYSAFREYFRQRTEVNHIDISIQVLNSVSWSTFGRDSSLMFFFGYDATNSVLLDFGIFCHSVIICLIGFKSGLWLGCSSTVPTVSHFCVVKAVLIVLLEGKPLVQSEVLIIKNVCLFCCSAFLLVL